MKDLPVSHRHAEEPPSGCLRLQRSAVVSRGGAAPAAREGEGRPRTVRFLRVVYMFVRIFLSATE